jgi:hypothetical protein
MHFVKAECHVQWRRAGICVLSAEIAVQAVGWDRQIPDPTLEEVPGEGGLRSDHQLGWIGPARELAQKRAEPAEVFLIGPLVGPYLSDGETEHR